MKTTGVAGPDGGSIRVPSFQLPARIVSHHRLHPGEKRFDVATARLGLRV
jgi:hypothetical protein